MIEISSWLDKFTKRLDETFAERIWFAGLQGSYGREEATQGSDIDVVLILDDLSPADIATYAAMLDTLPHRELVCGFLSGKSELLNWEPSDLFQFYHDTTPLRGSLEELLPLFDDACVHRAIKIGVGNIYHGCVHNMLHEQSEDALKSLYKAACFVVQAIYRKQTGQFIRRHCDLLDAVSPDERTIVNTYLQIKNGETIRFDEMSEALFLWAKSRLY